MASVIAYIDGFNLYHGLHDWYGRRHLWLDLVHLVRRLRPSDNLVAVRYFTACILNDPPGLARQKTFLDALEAQKHGLIEIVMGRYQSKQRTCRQCGSSWSHYEERRPMSTSRSRWLPTLPLQHRTLPSSSPPTAISAPPSVRLARSARIAA